VVAVAEVAQHLAGDGRYREGQEVDATAGFEPVDRQDQPEVRDLLQVVEAAATGDVPAGDVAGDRKVTGDQLVAQQSTARVVRGQAGALVEQRSEVHVLVGVPPGWCDNGRRGRRGR
jgi:hypothetical protein